MRKIQKKNHLEVLDDFKDNFNKKNGCDAQYKDLKAETYHAVKTALIKEQFGICCYCMSKIADYNSHIEHFIPQSVDCSKDLTYENMFASCNGYKENRQNCGHRKSDYYDEKLLISPLEENCENNFIYSINGEISSSQSNVRGEKTIKALNLDSTLLNRARRSAIYLSGLFEPDFDEQKEELTRLYSNPQNGELPPFCQAILYCIENF